MFAISSAFITVANREKSQLRRRGEKSEDHGDRTNARPSIRDFYLPPSFLPPCINEGLCLAVLLLQHLITESEGPMFFIVGLGFFPLLGIATRLATLPLRHMEAMEYITIRSSANVWRRRNVGPLGDLEK